jgi:hypothetical protein
VRRAVLVGDDFGGGEPPVSRDDLEAVWRTIRSDQEGLEDTTLANARQDIGHVGALLGKAHVGLADREVAQRHKS